jgi:uncharacterized membrane protein YhaH (DUF805 family)
VTRDAARSNGPRLRPVGRIAWALLALVAAVGEIAQLVLTADGAFVPGFGLDLLALRLAVVQHFSYFTTLSNVLVVVLAIGMAAGAGGTAGGRTGRAAVFWRWLLVTTLPAIVVTGAVHWVLLRPASDATGLPAVLSDVQHVVVPIGTVLIWALLGPRDRIRPRDLPGVLIFPVAYYLWTLWHGSMSGWYPYDFADVSLHGYGQVLLFGAVVLVLLLVIAEVARRWDQLLSMLARRRR